jgi:hypothetical protein
MANQTVTTTVNYDDNSISGLLNGEAITIDGGSVTINSDVRWNQQAAVFGAVTLSSTLGGSFLIDGTDVWELYFDASTGNVPTQDVFGGANGVTGTNGATGELLRVWATGSLTPATAGGAMPATGWIKLRSKTGNFVDNEVVTLPGGATITLTGAGKRSWIHIVGRGVTTGTGFRLTIARLNTFEATGDWYELGETNGNDDQTFQYPVADMCPAIWIETAPASGVYEIWLNAGDRWTNGAVATGDKRGMYFNCNPATGIITIAARTGNTAGLKPASGCKVRIPNIIMSQADGTTPNYDANILPVAIAARYGLTTTNAGSVIMDKVSCNWTTVTSAAFEIDIQNSGFGTQLGAFSNTGTTITLNNVGIGIVDTLAATPLAIATSYGGGFVTDVRFVRRLGASNGTGIALTDTADFTFTRVRGDVFGAVTTNIPNTTQSLFSSIRAINTTLLDCTAIGGIGIIAVPAFGVNSTNLQYASRTIGTTQTTDTAAIISANSGATDIFIDGISAFDNIPNVHPYTNIAVTATGVNNFEIRNIGTPSAPYNMGTVNPCGIILSSSSTRNVTLRRIYTENTRTSPFAVANTVQNFQAYNIWGDGADTQVNTAINSIIRGGRFTNSTSGGTAVYGTHWQDAWTSTTAGRIVIACNEPTIETTNQCSFTLDTANNSGFTSAGNVSMTQLTDEVVWTMPYYALGVTGFSNTVAATGTNIQNHEFEYQIDKNDENGFSAWKHLSNQVRRASGGTAGTNTVTVNSVDWDSLLRTPQIGDYVQTEDNRLPVGTTIDNIVGYTITFSNNITTGFSAGQMLYFMEDLPDETVTPADGVKLKIRATVNTASDSNLLTYIRVDTTTTSSDQQIEYPLPTTQNIGSVTNIRAGSRIRVFNVTTDTEIANEIVSGTSWTYNYDEGTDFTDGDLINVRLARCLGATASIGYEGTAVAGANGWALFADQIDDEVYNTNGIDGTAITEFTFDYPNIQIDIDDPDGTTTITRLYAWYANERATEAGIRVLIGGLIAEDLANYKIVSSKIDLKLDNTSSSGVIFTGGTRLYRDDGVAPVVSSTTGGGSITLYADKVYIAETGTSGLTPEESAKLDDILKETKTAVALSA